MECHSINMGDMFELTKVDDDDGKRQSDDISDDDDEMYFNRVCFNIDKRHPIVVLRVYNLFLAGMQASRDARARGGSDIAWQNARGDEGSIPSLEVQRRKRRIA